MLLLLLAIVVVVLLLLTTLPISESIEKEDDTFCFLAWGSTSSLGDEEENCNDFNDELGVDKRDDEEDIDNGDMLLFTVFLLTLFDCKLTTSDDVEDDGEVSLHNFCCCC